MSGEDSEVITGKTLQSGNKTYALLYVSFADALVGQVAGFRLQQLDIFPTGRKGGYSTGSECWEESQPVIIARQY